MLKLPSLRDASSEVYSLQEKTCKTDFFVVCFACSVFYTSFDFFIKTASGYTFGTHTLRFIYLSPEGIPGVGFEHLQWSTVGNIFTPLTWSDEEAKTFFPF